MTQDEVLNEIRLQTAILKAAFRDKLDALSTEVTSDEIKRTILELLEAGPASTGIIRTHVIDKVKGSSERTISRRIADLVETGVIRRSGKAGQTSYELTGLL